LVLNFVGLVSQNTTIFNITKKRAENFAVSKVGDVFFRPFSIEISINKKSELFPTRFLRLF
jgi:hypothetical protein